MSCFAVAIMMSRVPSPWSSDRGVASRSCASVK